MIEQRENGWAFVCQQPQGGGWCGFDSSGWDTEGHARLRARQHQREHTHGDLMPTTDEVRALTEVQAATLATKKGG